MNAGERVSLIDVKRSFQPRSVQTLDYMAKEINSYKDSLLGDVNWYLEKYRDVLSPPRLCTALEVPGAQSGKIISAADLESQHVRDLSYVSGKRVQITEFLRRMNRDKMKKLTHKQQKAIWGDVRELLDYIDMYYRTEIVRSNPNKYSVQIDGNPYKQILSLIEDGAVIVRFKYVSRNGSDPDEKIVSYHLTDDLETLAVHVHGDDRFILQKKWGHGDETLSPIVNCSEKRSENVVIRHKRDDVYDAIAGRKPDKEFLY